MLPSIAFSFSIGYLLLLFGIAYWAERKKSVRRRLVNNPYVYALSMAVYCTAWTYYGSVGRAAISGLDFLAIYVGPILMAPLGLVLMRRIIRISKVQRITSVADFISARYGKDRALGNLVTIFCIIGILPYISIQLKAIANSFSIITDASFLVDASQKLNPFNDAAFYMVIGLALFTIFFGTRKVDASERHEGMMAAIAIESVIKLVAFLAVGLYVTYGLFNGFGDIFEQANLLQVNTATDLGPNGYAGWFSMLVLSMIAIVLLPRQFQVSVVENLNERHLNVAMWLFPLYLVLINLFVVPIALGGNILFIGEGILPDTYVLNLPLKTGKPILAIFTYLGGFSAATSMIIVATIALSTMITNNLLMPLLVGNDFINKSKRLNLGSFLVFSRRISIVLVLLLAYLYYRNVAESYSLVNIGLISFAAVAQFAPAFFGGLFWKKANRNGALAGILIGFSIWFYTLVIPTLVGSHFLPESWLTDGPAGISWLNPQALFTDTGFDPLTQSLLWSLFFNLIAFFGFSLYTEQSIKERNQAEFFVDIFKYSSVYESSILWKGEAYIPDLETLLGRFLGEERAKKAIQNFSQRNDIALNEQQRADAKLVNYVEKVLAGIIGTASARIMVATVVKEEELSMDEVLHMLKESQNIMAANKALRRKSLELKLATEELSKANAALLLNDQLKDEFLTTVTHELRTPITSIRALSEILHDNPDLDEEESRHFLQTIVRETERLSRLISQVLDLERLESGQQKLNLTRVNMRLCIENAVDSVDQLIKEKGIKIKVNTQENLPTFSGDDDRLQQVIINLVSNSIKFCPSENGVIEISTYLIDGLIKVNVFDNGPGIPVDDQRFIFDKFYQANNQTIKKPKGSGLGLPICKKIITLHNGQIWLESESRKGSRFSFTIPVQLIPT